MGDETDGATISRLFLREYRSCQVTVAVGESTYVLGGGTTPGGSVSDLNKVFIVLGRR